MSAISLKSITGITSITTPAGVDNQLTLHNNNTTEAVKLDIAGNLHFHNHLNITGVSTASNFKTGTSNLHNTGLNVFDLDVDGHANLDNVSIAGVATATTFVGALTGTASGNPTLTSGANNRVITATGANTLEGESTLTYNGSGTLNVLGASGNTQLALHRTNTNTTGTAGIIGFYASDAHAIASMYALGDGDNEGAHLVFNTTTAASGANPYSNVTERLRITSDGKIGIGGETSPEWKVTVYDAGYTGVTIKTNRNTATDNIGGLHFKTRTTNVAYIQSLVDGTIKFRNSSSLDERVRIKSTGELLVGTTNLINSSTSKFQVASNNANGSAILARFNASVYSSYLDFYKSRSNTLGTAYAVNDDDHLGAIRYYAADGSNSGYTTAAEIYGSCDGGSGSAGDMPGRITFHTRPDGAGQSMQERLRIDSRGDVYFSESTPLSSPNPAYRRISIANNLILNANASAGGYTGFQNNAYINSSGNWVRVNNDFASSIGMDDGVLYFRNVGAGTGNISWSTPMTIYPNGTTTMNTTITLNGQIISSGASGRGGKFGNIQIGFGALNNTVQNIVANTPLHLQYDNAGDVRVNEGGGDMQTRDIFPESNNSYSLGTDAKRWANIHTNDLNLSNEGSKNDVDGTWGQYTIQEGENDLFLINKRNGKRYKFLVQEID